MNPDPAISRTSYDEVPYDSFPFPQTRPNRLAPAELLREALKLLRLPEPEAAQAGLSAEETLTSDLLQSWTAGLIELHAGSAPFAVKPGPWPVP